MEKENLSNEESLKIITNMIYKTKVNINQSSFHLLFWGWLIFICSLSDFLISELTNYTHPYYVWFFVIPGVFVSMIYGFVSGRKAKFHTYADMLYMWTWFTFLITAVVLFFLQSSMMDSFAPFILMLAGFPTFMSGIIIKFRPLIVGAISFWVLAIAGNFLGAPYVNMSVPLAMIIGYLIPGYVLRNRIKHEAA